MISEEESKTILKEREEFYRGWENHLWNLKTRLEEDGGRSVEYKQLLLAIESYRNKLNRDRKDYKSYTSRLSLREELRFMQTALNRERKLRENLEDKIKEATESSGLFIKFVKDKLGL